MHFLHNVCKPQELRPAGALTVVDLKEAQLYWTKWAQQDRFQAEIESLAKGHPVPRTTHIASLDPQLVDGVLRVGG